MNYWKRQIYNINSSIKIDKPAPTINFNKSEFNLGYALKFDNNDSFIDPQNYNSMMTINLTLVTISDFQSQNKTKLDIVRKNCQTKDFFQKISEFDFNTLNLSYFYCAYVNDSSIQLEGTFTDPKFTFIELSVFIEDNYFKKGNFSKLSKFLNENAVKLVLYWTDSTIDVTSYESPVSNFIRTYVLYIDFNMLQKINLELSTIRFSTDDNMIMENPFNNNLVAYKEQVQYNRFCDNRTILGGTLGKTLTKIYIKSSPSSSLINRNYQKLSVFFANFAGLASNILLVLYILFSYLNEFWANQIVMNKIIKFREHLKVSYPIQLDLLKNSFKKNTIILESSLPEVNLEYPNSKEKISEIFNTKRIFEINELNSKEENDCNRKRNNSAYKVENQIIELNRKLYNDDSSKINQDKSLDSLKLSKDGLMLNDKIINDNLIIDSSSMNNENIKIKDINWNKITNKRESIHHVKLNERQKIVPIDKLEEKLFSKSKKALNFNCFEIIFRNFSCKSKKLTFKSLLYDKASKKMNYYFDVYTYIRKMQEIDILKYLLFDKNQINLFNFLTKPSVSKLYSDSDDIYQNIQKNREFHHEIQIEEVNDIIKSYDSINGNNDDLNKKLLYLFNYEVDNLLIG